MNHLRTQEVTDLKHIPGGKAVLRELTVGEMRKLRRDVVDPEERGIATIAISLVEPAMTVEQLDALPASALPDLERLTQAMVKLSQPEVSDPPA